MAATVVGLVTGCGTWLYIVLKPTPIPPLLQDLPPAPFRVASEKFSERLGTRFPIGSAESELIHELRLEGFTAKTESHAPQREAAFDTLAKGGLNICRTQADVTWTADADGRLRSISGHYAHDCP